MIPSVVLNVLNAALVLGSVVSGLRKSDPKRSLFYFFTTLSNVLCALASLAVATAWASGGLPFGVLLLKYAGTAAVSVTMLTVLFFLGPTTKEWKLLLSGEQLLLHLVCPLLAIVSFLFFEKTAMPAWTIAVGTAPVVLYAILYWYKVVHVPAPRGWNDFYGFNRNGKWPVSVGAMILAAALIAFLLWLV